MLKHVIDSWAVFTNLLERIGRDRARRELMRLSDRRLADMGISRASLELGVDAWPWQDESDPAPSLALSRRGLASGGTDAIFGNGIDIEEFRHVVQELRTCDDATLASMGVARFRLSDVMTHRRTKVDNLDNEVFMFDESA